MKPKSSNAKSRSTAPAERVMKDIPRHRQVCTDPEQCRDHNFVTWLTDGLILMPENSAEAVLSAGWKAIAITEESGKADQNQSRNHCRNQPKELPVMSGGRDRCE